MDKSVDLIREATKSDKVSLFGYCWGGDLVLMYAAFHPEKVKNVILVATPGDVCPHIHAALIVVLSKLGIIIKIYGSKSVYLLFVLINRWILRQPLLSVLWPLQQ